jgi:hypothetical protein
VRKLILSNLEGLGIHLDLEKNEQKEIEICHGKIKVLVIPTNEELAIARDTCKVLQSITKTVGVTTSESHRPKDDRQLSREEKAQLVLIWAQSPNVDPEELTHRLEQKLGRTIPAVLVEQELEQFGLISTSVEKDHD